MMSEDKEQAVAEEVNEQSQETVSETDGAQEQKSDDLESLLNEFNAETGASQPEQKTETKPDDPTVERLSRLEQQLQEREYRDDIGRVISDIRGDLNPDQFDNEFMDAWINAQAKKDARIANAWLQRHNDPTKFNRVVGGLGKEFAKKYGKLTGVDEDATADHEAVAAAVRGTGNKAPEEKAPEYGSMTDAEMRETVRKQHGYTPSI